MSRISRLAFVLAIFGVLVLVASAQAKDPQLNLSHIECVDGAVEVHFVLLFAGANANPGTLTYTYGTIDPEGFTGNAWHYRANGLEDGTYDVLEASVTLGDGTVVELHNPSDPEHTGTFVCGGPPPSGCELPEPQELVCLDVLGNPEDECAHWGLEYLGKDDGVDAPTHAATQGASFALVKDGAVGCDSGLAYRIYTEVSPGQILEQPAGSGDISHVTYCGCP